MKEKDPIDSIKGWAEADRPREKLLQKGRAVLSDAELIAILIGSGSRNESAVALSKRILNKAGNHLQELGKMSVMDLMKFKGIGEAKAITIAAALELGRRRASTEPVKKPQITCSRDAYQLLRVHLQDISHEEMWMLLLNKGGYVVHKMQLHVGGTAQTVVDVKMIMKTALEHLAHGVILAHNHPSGTLRPSAADDKVTKKIYKAGQLLDVKLHDHLIITDGGFWSFADNNYFDRYDKED